MGVALRAQSFNSDTVRLDSTIRAYMIRNNVPGLCLAFCKNDKIVFAKGYGYAIKDTLAAEPSQLFRIASVSKPITSLAIMNLVAEGKLHLGDKVFGPSGILKQFPVPAANGLALQITVSHLLHHVSGFINAKGDPAFMDLEMTTDQMIQWELDNEIITHPPGDTMVYLNFGYILLARIIDRVSGIPYAQYVQSTILERCGIRDMQIGKNSLLLRLPLEAEYYSFGAFSPYSLDLNRMEGNGGWIASAVDLARVLVHINGDHGVPDILPSLQMDSLTEVLHASRNYGCGFIVWSNHAKGHNGAMPGTNALIHDAGDGGGWTVVMNGRAEKDGFAWGLDVMLRVFYSSIHWPDTNKFSLYEN